MLKIGRFEIQSVITGTFRLDGGAMFGVVPKTLWAGVTDCDDRNRIHLATRTLLAVDRTAGRTVLVDTGCGTKWAPDQTDRFAIRYDRAVIPQVLEAFGLTLQDVTDVIVTHLHFDHNGGLTEWYDDPGGRTCLRFPQARHWVHRKQWEHAHDPTLKDRASFVRHDFDLLGEKGVLQLVEGDAPPPPFEGVEWFISRGHTPYQLLPIFVGEETKLLFAGDVVPTMAHLRVPWVMAYDLYPLTTIAEKVDIFRRATAERLLLAFPHDPTVGGVAVGGTVERPIVERQIEL